MGFCTEDEYLEFMRQAPEFERHLVKSGIHVIKFWFSVSRDEQRRRFKERKIHPLKQWKLSPIDLASLEKWDEYSKAKEAMFIWIRLKRLGLFLSQTVKNVLDSMLCVMYSTNFPIRVKILKRSLQSTH